MLKDANKLQHDLVLSSEVGVGLAVVPGRRDAVMVNKGGGEVVDGNMVEEDVGDESSGDPTR